MTIKYQVVLDISMAELVAIITAGSLDETDIQSAMLKAGQDALKSMGSSWSRARRRSRS
jgi:hypothetical protein